MKIKNQYIIVGWLLAITLIFSSCSTKKKSWVNRQYHNTTAKYNGYFNGNESIKKGVKKIYKNYTDDYTTILPLYKTGNLAKEKKTHSYMDKAIKKGSIVIQRHSIKIRGKEYCKWIDDNYLLVGKAYFYKGEFDEAIKTFSFIKNEYNKNEIRFNASLWLVRSYVQKQDFIAAEMELDEIKNERKFPEKLDTELTKVSADYYLQQNNFSLALEQLKKLDKLIKRKRKKVRYNYIMAQIYQQYNNHKQAKKQYETVIKSNPEYEMAFNAKMNLAKSLESGSKDLEKMRQKLLKMIKDDKNKEYLDQIYYTLAEIDINNNDTLAAINNYLLSTINSVQNDPQKSLSFLSLGEIEYSRSKYSDSKIYYDSTIFYMDEDFRLYAQVKEKHNILVDLVRCLDIITMQDSLQMLAKLPAGELNRVINQIIQNEAKKEREQLENERAKQQIMYENNRNGGKGEQFGNNTSGGKWYFYNPATLSFGMSEFRKRWGKRKLEDDWRRKDKKISTNFDVDSTTVDSTISIAAKNNPNYYLEKLPKTEEDFEASDTQIKEAHYQAGIIYKEDLQEYQKSTNMFTGILSRFPKDEQFAPLSYYTIYLNQTKQNNFIEAKNTKTLLLTHYPNSVYAKILTDPDFKKELLNIENELEEKYQLIYQDYLQRNFSKVITSTDTLQKNEYETKYMFLRALSFVEIKDTVKLKKELQSIINIAIETKIGQEAQYLLSTLNDPSKMTKANEIALLGSPYLFRSSAPHMSIIIMPKQGVDINYLKILISDYHAIDFENEVFEISAMMMGLEQHLLMIKTFTTAENVMSYTQLLKSNITITNELNKSDYKMLAISMENFMEFYKNKDVEGYCNFFKKNYLDNN